MTDTSGSFLDARNSEQEAWALVISDYAPALRRTCDTGTWGVTVRRMRLGHGGAYGIYLVRREVGRAND